FGTLKFKIVGLSVSLVLLLGITSALLILKSTDENKHELMQNYQGYAQRLGDAIAAQFYERYNDAQAFAQNAVLQANDKGQIIAAFDSYASLSGTYSLILYVDLKGNLVAVNDKDPSGKKINVQPLYSMNFANEPWFKNTLDGHFTEDKKRGFQGTYFEDVKADDLIFKAYDKQTLATGFSTRVYNAKHEIIGVISNRVNFSWVENEVRDLYENLKNRGLKSTELTLLNSMGQVIVDHDPIVHSQGVNEIVHDFDKVLLKLNLRENHVDAAMALSRNETGFSENIHARKHLKQVTGYSSISSDKFIPTIGWGVLVRTSSDEAFAQFDKVQRDFLIINIVGICIAIIVSIFFSKKISQSVVETYDELDKSKELVATNSRSLQEASLHVSSSSSESAASLEETVASVEEISSIVKVTASSSQTAAELSEKSYAAAKNGAQQISNLIDSMESILASSKKISEIINVIDDIAFQTNLLALNASVEAARAGEQGRGFSIVAEAVRGLAQRSALAAKDISVLIKESGSNVEKGDTIARQTEVSFKEIFEASEKLTVLVKEIASTSNEQSRGLQQIATAMNQIDQATQSNASTAEELSASADALLNETGSLDKHVMALKKIVYGEQKNQKMAA
ncbi:MAG TPA: methyl-accepting chemotaxis protein, partial [Bdellovibrio sp.]|nr:methyl-accepting chemotaxis protein [Bdellovibrio sp.]